MSFSYFFWISFHTYSDGMGDLQISLMNFTIVFRQIENEWLKVFYDYRYRRNEYSIHLIKSYPERVMIEVRIKQHSFSPKLIRNQPLTTNRKNTKTSAENLLKQYCLNMTKFVSVHHRVHVRKNKVAIFVEV